MEIFVGKTVKIKSREWFNENEDINHRVVLEGIPFWANMADIYCSKIRKISKIDGANIYLEGEPSYVFSKKLFDEEFDEKNYPKLKYKVGDKVKVKSLDWYNCYANLVTGSIVYDNNTFMRAMSKYCSCYLTIKKINNLNNYEVIENSWQWSDEMLDASSLITSNNNNSNKYKVGDRVKVKSKEWYLTHSGDRGIVNCIDSNGKRLSFTSEMKRYCNTFMTIKSIRYDNRYTVTDNIYVWCDSMLEEVVEPALKAEIIIPKFNIGDVVTFTSITTGKLYIFTIKDISQEDIYVYESEIIFTDYSLEKIGKLPPKNTHFKFCRGDKVRFLNNVEIEGLTELNKKAISAGMYQYIGKQLTIEYTFFDLNRQPRYKMEGSNEIWSGWMLKYTSENSEDNENTKITTETNILSNCKTKLNIIKTKNLNLKISSEVKIQLKPKKPIKYESCSSS